MPTSDSLDIREVANGVQIGLRAQPGARREGICGLHAGRIKVAVAAPPDKGKANEAIVRVLADLLGLKRSQLTITGGLTSREKTLLVEGFPLVELQERIGKLLRSAAGSSDS